MNIHPPGIMDQYWWHIRHTICNGLTWNDPRSIKWKRNHCTNALLLPTSKGRRV